MTFNPNPPQLRRALEDFAVASRGISGLRQKGDHGLVCQFNGSPVDPTQIHRIPVFWSSQIIEWYLCADTPGNLMLAVEWASYADYPAFASIVAGAPPTLAGVIKNRQPTFETWRTLLLDGGWLRVYPLGTPTVNEATLAFRVREL